MHKLIFTLMLLLPGLCTATSIFVSIILDTEKSTHNSFLSGFKSVIENSKTIRYNIINPGEAPAQAQSLALQKADIIVTVGSQYAADPFLEIHNKQIINTMLPAAIFYDLSHNNKEIYSHHAVFVDPSPLSQLSYIKKRFGSQQKIGILTGPSSRHTIKQFTDAAKELDLNIIYKHAASLESSPVMIKDLAHDADILLALYDPVVMNSINAKWLLYTAYNAQKPVIGYSQSYLSAGAAAAIYTTPDLIGKQTASLILEITNKKEIIKRHIYILKPATEENPAIMNRLGFSTDDNEK